MCKAVFKFSLEEPFKCRCGYESYVGFAIANDKIQAEEMAKIGRLYCANCIVDLIMSKGYKLCLERDLRKFKGGKVLK
jgi:hypothetical protein